MVGKEPDIGPTARAVADNVKRLRELRKLNYTELSDELRDLADWSINAVGIRRIESGERRVTPDDLVALALVLRVSPNSLLLPHAEGMDENTRIAVTGHSGPIDAGSFWSWLMSFAPLLVVEGTDYFFYLTEAVPPWARVDPAELVKRARADGHD